MYIVTGGAGFIGSNLVRRLNEQGIDDILVVDDLTDGDKVRNLSDCRVRDYLDINEFLERVRAGQLPGIKVSAVLHQGANSDTTDRDGRRMMWMNFEYSKQLLHACLKSKIPFIYASSASVYGSGSEFRVAPDCERPLNVYAFSKLLMDNHVRSLGAFDSQVVGLRYFNVYGPREHHKGRMASVALHFSQQLESADEVRLFEGSGGYGDGEQRRDFVYVDDVVSVNLWFLNHPAKSGIFNVGTGRSQTFNDVARAVIDWYERGRIQYVPFPAELVGKYQSFTEADISALRAVGYTADFMPVERGVFQYMESLAGG